MLVILGLPLVAPRRPFRLLKVVELNVLFVAMFHLKTQVPFLSAVVRKDSRSPQGLAASVCCS